MDVMESIMTSYRKTIWNRFTKSVREFDMIEPGDRIAVCISGGKDSMLLAKCMEKYQQISGVPFSVVYLSMDPGYKPENRQLIIENAGKLGLKLDMFNTNIFRSLEHDNNNPCFLCARLRRGALYSAAIERNCNKIALGHHFDDFIETILMGMLYGGQLQTMLPRLKSRNYGDIQVIRPLCRVREEDIISWTKTNSLQFLRCACTVASTEDTEQQSASKRQEIKELIRTLKSINPQIEHNIFRSVWNVDLKRLISYHDGSEYHSFMERL